MRVLGLLAAWGVLAVLATMCFALGGSIGYRRGVRDTLAQVRDRRVGKSGCRPLPANHMRRRSSGHARPGARARRSRWRVPAMSPRRRRSRIPVDPRITVLGATIAAVLLLGVPATAVGATTAQPGESLYPVKRGMEQVRLALSVGPERDAKVHIDLAATRLAELTALVGRDASSAVIADVSQDLEKHAAAASATLDGASDTPDRSRLQQQLSAVASQQVEVMDVAVEGCADADPECETLEQTRDETVALDDTTAGDVPTVVAGEVLPSPETPAQADAQASAAPSAPAAAGAAGEQTSVAAATEVPPDTTDDEGAGASDGEQPAIAGSAAELPPEPSASESSTARPSESPSATASPSATPSAGATAKPEPSTAPADTPAGRPRSPSGGSSAPEGGSQMPGSDHAADDTGTADAGNEPATDGTRSEQRQ